jgi:hypothetical protein
MIIKPKLLSKSEISSLKHGNSPVSHSISSLPETNVSDENNIRYARGNGVKSTQQLRVNWSNFSDHTFFQSAVVKTNVAFDNIINEYPFDGSRAIIESFEDSLTGFEKWVLDSFPKSVGYVQLSGTNAPEASGGAYLQVQDSKGYLYPETISESGLPAFVTTGSFCLEFHANVPSRSNANQAIFQMLGTDQGLSVHLSGSSTSNATIEFNVWSGSLSLSSQHTAQKGVFNHHACVYDSETGTFRTYLNGAFSSESSTVAKAISIRSSVGPAVTIATGTNCTFPGGSISLSETFSGSLDELRFFKSARTADQISYYRTRNVFRDSTNELSLCYRFNEPNDGMSSGTLSRFVLDYSGNSLHSLWSDSAYVTRVTGTRDQNPLTNERERDNHVLFASNQRVESFNQELITSGTEYDLVNPNTITRLVPPHYLLDGKNERFDDTIYGNATDAYSAAAGPGTGKTPAPQEFLGLLHSYAQYYDELKLFVASAANLRFVDYNEYDTAPDEFLRDLAKSYGITLPPLYVGASLGQYTEGYDSVETNDSERSLEYVQNELTRRFLTSANHLLRSKGTQESIKGTLRAYGLDPNNTFKIKERGGTAISDIRLAREKRSDVFPMVSFGDTAGVVLSYLSSSRIEVGSPSSTAFVQQTQYPPHGISPTKSDGLFTSGSWTFETYVRFPTAASRAGYATIARFATTGTISTKPVCWGAVTAYSSSLPGEGHITFAVCPYSGSVTNEIVVSGSIYDGSVWHIAAGRDRADIASGSFAISSSYFLYVTRQTNDGGTSLNATSSFVYDGASSILQNISTSHNASGSMILFGAGTGAVATGAGFIEGNEFASGSSGYRLGRTRWWNHALSYKAIREHALDPYNYGSDDALSSGLRYSDVTGSWGRLRSEIFVKQTEPATSAGAFSFANTISGSLVSGIGSGFEASVTPYKNAYFEYTHIAPSFDESITDYKIRIRSYQDRSSFEGYSWEDIAPVTRINPKETSYDNPYVTVEMGLVDIYNRDIIRSIGNPELLDTYMGAVHNLYDDSYSDIAKLVSAHSSRLAGRVNFKTYHSFFKWIQASIGDLLAQFIPNKARFNGMNYVIEPGLHERARIRYIPPTYYISESDSLRDRQIGLTLITGLVRRY